MVPVTDSNWSQAVKHNTIKALKGFTESNVCLDVAFSKDSEESAFILYINRQMATEVVKQKEWGAEWEVNVREKQSMSFKTTYQQLALVLSP